MNASRPRILYICPAWPHGQAHGGQLRALHIGRALQQCGDVTLLMAGSDADSPGAQEKTAEEFRVAPAIRLHATPQRGLREKIRWALDVRYLDVHGAVASAADRERVLRCAREHDMVWVMNARTPSVLQIWRWPRTHLDLDDIPSAYRPPAGSISRDWLVHWKAGARRLLLRRREQRFHERFTTLSVCSDNDRRYLGGKRVHVIPNGFARPSVEPMCTPSAHAPRLGFIGLYSYAPNLDGMRWFLGEVWPLVQQAVPGVRFRLVGKDTTGALEPAELGVDALGWLADPAAEIATWSAMVVPIRFGGGTRIKLADAFSRKCPVVSTPFGAYGYAVESGRQLLLADSPARFAAACISLLQDQARARALAERAWTDFLTRWTWEAITPRISATVADCLGQNAARMPALSAHG